MATLERAKTLTPRDPTIQLMIESMATKMDGEKPGSPIAEELDGEPAANGADGANVMKLTLES